MRRQRGHRHRGQPGQRAKRDPHSLHVATLFRTARAAYTIRHHATRRPVPRDRPVRDRLPAALGQPCHVLGAGRQSAWPAGAVPARRPRRRRRRGAPPLLRSRVLARGHLRPARRRPLAPSRQPGEQHHPGPGIGHRDPAAASRRWSAGCCSAVPGDPPWRWPMPRRIRSGSSAACCAACSWAAPAEVDWFLHGLAAIFPDAHAGFVGFPAGGGAAAMSSPAICAA